MTKYYLNFRYFMALFQLVSLVCFIDFPLKLKDFITI